MISVTGVESEHPNLRLGHLVPKTEKQSQRLPRHALSNPQGTTRDGVCVCVCACGGGVRIISTERVKARWPPRCTAALEAFFALERSAKALDYDGMMKEFQF
eukprot:4149705-Pyramimonas_sp.AAC.1